MAFDLHLRLRGWWGQQNNEKAGGQGEQNRSATEVTSSEAL
jgi:hypothetical protein